MNAANPIPTNPIQQLLYSWAKGINNSFDPAPPPGTPTVGTPNVNTGVVTGSLGFPTGGGLTFTATQPSQGSVTITPSGTYTYTPTQAARQVATATTTDAFTATVHEGLSTNSVTVTVPVDPGTPVAGVSAIGSVTITGDRPGSLLLSATGTRALLITAYPPGTGSTTRVAVIDTASGSQVGTTFTMTGPQAAQVQLSADGTRALITSSVLDAAATRVAVLDTTTGTQVGTTFTLAGGGSAQFIANDSRALITTTAYSQSTNTTTTRAAVLDTTTGTQAGATIALAGYGSAALSPDGAHALIITEAHLATINTVTGTAITAALTGSWGLEQWSADGSRALISSRVTDAAGTTTQVVVIDTTTGAQIGTTLTVTGNGSVQSNADGTRALITSKVTSAASATTRIAAFNTTTGTQIGTTLVLAGDGSVQTNADGSRALITSDVYESATASHSTELTVFNTATGSQTGTTLTLTGGLLSGVQPKFSPDGTRALITTDVYDSTTTLRTSRVTTIDTTTGTKIGTTLSLNGPEPVETTWLADGIRALVTMTPTQYDSVISPMLVAVLDTTTGTQAGNTLSLTGMPTLWVEPVVTPDGKHALITTNDYSPAGTSIRVATVDTTSGTQVGTTITLTAAASGRTVLSPNANRAIITAGDQVAIVNTTTGTQVGTTVAVDGTPSDVLFSGGTRAVITTATSVTVIDTSTGTQTGTTLTLAASRPLETMPTADGTHALVTTGYRSFVPAIPTTPVALIDLTTGTQIGSTLTLAGDTYASPAFTLNGTRALIATSVDSPSTTRVTTINTATGMPTGTTVTLNGVLSSGVDNPLQVVLSPDGARALIATTSDSCCNFTSQVAVINAATGTQIGTTATINGALSGLRWSTDGTRVFVTTYITTATGGDLSIQETVLKIF